MAQLTDRQRLKRVQASQLASNEPDMVSTAKAVVAAASNRSTEARISDGGTAATGVAESPFANPRNKGTVRSVQVLLPVAVAADNTDYVTFTVSKRTAAGAGVTLATGTTQITGLGAVAAFVPFPLTLTATTANLIVAVADALTVTVAKAGAGKAISAATSYGVATLDLEED